MNIRQYLSDLSSLSIPNVFNPYKDICEQSDHSSSPAIRRLNLEIYLTKVLEVGVDSVWLGRDFGYRGGRRTGIALTDEVHLDALSQRWGLSGINKATLGIPVKERTATEIWKRVSEVDCKIFLWNVFPFHPVQRGEPMSNRRHSIREFAVCRELLRSLLSHLKPRTIVALGADAYQATQRLGIAATKIRHPSYGGHVEFAKGIRDLLGCGDANRAQ